MIKRLFGAALCHVALLTATTTAAEAQRRPETLQAVMLRVHNLARQDVRAAPLVWNEALAAEALGWARQLAREGRMRHSGRAGHGENLWVGTRDAYSHSEMAQLWVDEKRHFVNRPTPDFSTTGNFADVGHYTQIIWPDTTQLGCAIASDREFDYLVCRYTAPGNVMGQRALPVR